MAAAEMSKPAHPTRIDGKSRTVTAWKIPGCQVTGNTVGQGGDIFAVPGSPVTLKLTLVAKNTPDSCASPGTIAGYKN
jgi:hypothetical protein